jgi:serine/threonine protein kinase/tetratricopeptide (TPR) repeat protein
MSAHDDERAAEIVGRCRERIERGEPVDVDAVLREHPDLAPRLARSLGGLRLVERAYAKPAAPQRPSRVGAAVGPYRLVRELGSGGMGTVYLATAERQAAGVVAGECVAVKVLHAHLCTRPGFVERFLREAEIGRRVRHANVVRTLDAGESAAGNEHLHYLVMEHVEGQTLRALLAELGRVPEELCRHVGREIARALAAIHAGGAVHRDLKPDNVLITKDHVVKVMDLGVARVLGDEMRISQSGAFVGSLHYGAPEQFTEGRDVDGRADLHALGLVLYELATGAHPLGGDDVHVVVRRLLDERPRRAGEVNPQLSPFFEELLAQLLAKDRAERPADAQTVLGILEEGEESAWWKARSAAMRIATRRPLRRIRIPRESALYGRESELALLRSLYQRASKGDGQVVLVEGEAGIGKSRLVDEFALALHAAGDDFDFLHGSYPPGGAATASGAFSTAYREHLGDDEDAIRTALPQTPLLVPAFKALLCGDLAPEGAEKLTKDSLQTVFVHATRTFAARRTTIVLIDDLHFAPEEGRALFMALALAVPEHRILLVGAARPSLEESWTAQLAARRHTTRLPLARLGPKELVHLLRDALKSERLAEELAGLIAVKSDGNPFFVFELLRGLRDGRFLRQRPDGTWETTQVIRDIRVPSSITELVQARVADLGPDEKNLLDAAACCGFEFDPLVVGRALRRDRVAVLQSLGRIEKRHRLVRAAGRRFVFDHHQVQEALYAGLSELLREEYHAMLGDAIEVQTGAASREPPAIDGAVCVELAEHFLKGAQGARAMRYLDSALTHLESVYLSDATIQLADHALAAPGLVAGVERANLLLRVVGTNGPLDRLGRRDEQRRAIEELLALSREIRDRQVEAVATGNLGGLFKELGRYAEAREHHERHLALARETGDRRGEANATGNLGYVLGSLGRYAEAREHYGRSLALAREIGDRRGESISTGNLGTVLYSLGRHAEAREHFERHLALAREVGDRRGEATATGNLGNVLDVLGRHAEAQEHHERHLALAREIGDRRGEAVATSNLGTVLYSLGRHAEAREHHERTLALAREIGDRQGEIIATSNLGTVLYSLGRHAEAREHFERHLALAREIEDRRGEAIALVDLGPLRLRLGDARAAREDLLASLALCREMGARHPEGYALQRLGEVADEEGDVAAAARLVEESLALRRDIGHGDGVADSLLELGDLRRRSGDAAGARAALDEAVALTREQGRKPQISLGLALSALLPGGAAREAEAALADAGEAGDSPRVRLLLWEATRDRAHLAHAKRLLDDLVAHAPPECRDSMLANVRVNREIVAAAREHGLG